MSFRAVTTRAVPTCMGRGWSACRSRPGGAMTRQHKLPVSDVSEALQRLLSWYEVPRGQPPNARFLGQDPHRFETPEGGVGPPLSEPGATRCPVASANGKRSPLMARGIERQHQSAEVDRLCLDPTTLAESGAVACRQEPAQPPRGASVDRSRFGAGRSAQWKQGGARHSGPLRRVPARATAGPNGRPRTRDDRRPRRRGERSTRPPRSDRAWLTLVAVGDSVKASPRCATDVAQRRSRSTTQRSAAGCPAVADAESESGECQMRRSLPVTGSLAASRQHPPCGDRLGRRGESANGWT